MLSVIYPRALKRNPIKKSASSCSPKLASFSLDRSPASLLRSPAFYSLFINTFFTKYKATPQEIPPASKQKRKKINAIPRVTCRRDWDTNQLVVVSVDGNESSASCRKKDSESTNRANLFALEWKCLPPADTDNTQNGRTWPPLPLQDIIIVLFSIRHFVPSNESWAWFQPESVETIWKQEGMRELFRVHRKESQLKLKLGLDNDFLDKFLPDFWRTFTWNQ